MAYTPRFRSTQSQLVGSELFSYWPMRIQLTPASNIRVHHQRFQGKYGSRGRSELMPKPSRICDDRLGGTRSGMVCAAAEIASKSQSGRHFLAMDMDGCDYIERRGFQVRRRSGRDGSALWSDELLSAAAMRTATRITIG